LSQSRRSDPFFSSSIYCPIARISCPVLRRYPASIFLSARGSRSCSLLTCCSKSGMCICGCGCVCGAEFDADLEKREGRRFALNRCVLRRETGSGAGTGAGCEGSGVTEIVFDRCIRPGGARGPPGIGGGFEGWSCLAGGWGPSTLVLGDLLVRTLLGVGGDNPPFLRLVFRPIEKKKPPPPDDLLVVSGI